MQYTILVYFALTQTIKKIKGMLNVFVADKSYKPVTTLPICN